MSRTWKKRNLLGVLLLCGLFAIVAATQTSAIYGPITTPSLTIGLGPTIHASSGGTAQFLRADGQWAVPSGSGTSGPIYAQTTVAAGDTVASGCSGTGCDFANGAYTWAAGTFCPSVGTVYTVYAAGLVSTTGTGGNAGEDLYLNGTLVGDAQMYLNASLTNLPWSISARIVCDTTGASGTAEVSYQGVLQPATSSNNSASLVSNPPNVSTFTVNATAAVTLESRAHFSSATGSATERQIIITSP